MNVPVRKYSLDHVLANMLPILWRRRRIIYVGVLLASCAAFVFYAAVGDRYEVYTLMRVGQGIKEKAAGGNGPFGEGIDLVSRIDSLARIGTTDQVILEAMNRVGLPRLFKEADMTLLARFRQNTAELLEQKTAELLGLAASKADEQQTSKTNKQQTSKANKQQTSKADEQQTNLGAVAASLRDLISARQEGRSDLLRISFRFPDPAVAAEFLNQLANSLVGAQAALVQVPGAGEFFHEQAGRLEQEAEKAAADMKDFSVAASIYSAADQRGLLLQRASALSTLMATTRGSIEERKGQKQAIVNQLHVMRPVTQSKTVTGIVNSLAGREGKAKEAAENLLNVDETPPLLLVKVYQDSMANLLKINSELNGALKLESSLREELDSVNAQLADLTSKESEYERLKRVLTRASSAADYYGTRMMEEQINLESAKKTQLSSVRVVQLADNPIVPMFPRISHLVMLALLGGIGLGATLALLLEIAKLQREHEEDADRSMANNLTKFTGRNPMVAAE